MKLTLGPILYEWKKEEILDFYDEALSSPSPIDLVLLGEVTCNKKLGLTISEIKEVGRKLLDAGKEVGVSTLAVISNNDEVQATKEIIAELSELGFIIEVNDDAALAMVEKAAGESRKTRLRAGPHIKTYNTEAIRFLKDMGVEAVTLPVELPLTTIKELARDGLLPIEVFAYGRLPLAFSWRCYTERAYGLTKDDCQHHCIEHPEGMTLKTMDNEEVFTINGTSILSARPVNLIGSISELKEAGVTSLRLSPERSHTKEVAEAFKKVIDEEMKAGAALKEVEALTGEKSVNGYLLGRAGKFNIEQLLDNAKAI